MAHFFTIKSNQEGLCAAIVNVQELFEGDADGREKRGSGGFFESPEHLCRGLGADGKGCQLLAAERDEPFNIGVGFSGGQRVGRQVALVAPGLVCFIAVVRTEGYEEGFHSREVS